MRFFPQVFVAAILVPVIADIAAVIAYSQLRMTHGTGFFDFNHALYIDFLKTPVGAILTILGVVPWIALLIWLWLPRNY